jgi:hypothetical protein
MKLDDTEGEIGINHKASGPAYYYNNVLIVPFMDDAIGAAFNMSTATVPNVTMKNNIFYVTGCEAVRVQQTGGTYDFDNNCYYRTDAGDVWHWGAGSYDAIADWRTASGQDANAMEADPDFVDLNNDNVYLKGTSPCIRTGAGVSLTQDYDGQTVPRPYIYGEATPDIGAYEYYDCDIDMDLVRG